MDRDPEISDEPTFRLGDAAPPVDSLAGRMVGPYRLVRQIGEGGMGVVYLGERADGQFEKKVAVKLIREGEGSSGIVRRFAAERQTLASLEHPNIARLLDAGTTVEGYPYLVMEYVEGETIDAFCDGRQLDVTARLRLYDQVFAALQHAHRNLVVHRDLKPSNILVTGDGTVKLLDFGIAKLLPGAAGTDTARHTVRTERVMTPAWASPEQMRGEAISTLSDVYSLGVVLFQLLTGRMPYEVHGKMLADIERAVCETEARRPGSIITLGSGGERRAAMRGATPLGLRRRLAGDLDRILLMALRKEPERRYSSVEQLAADIRRHLAGEPVLARGDSVSYRLGRFVRRHRTVVALTAVAVVALIGGLVATAWQARIAAVERDRARAEAARAQAVTRFVQHMLWDPSEQGEQVTVLEALDRAAGQTLTEFADDPLTEASVLFTIAYTYRTLGRWAQAERHFRRALAIRSRVLGAEDPDTAMVLAEIAIVRHDRGDLAGAEELQREALATLERHPPTPALAIVLNSLGVLQRQRGNHDDAEQLYRRALATYASLPGDHRLGIVEVRSNLGVLEHARGNLEAAREQLELAVDAARDAHGTAHPDVARCLRSLAGVLDSMGRLDDAEAAYRQALEMSDAVYGPAHPDVAWTVVELADVLGRAGRLDEAEALARRGLALRREQLPAEHPLTARAILVLAQVLLRSGSPKQGLALAEEAAAVRRAILPAGHWLIASADATAGSCLLDAGRLDAAEVRLDAAYTILAAGGPPQIDRSREVARDLATLCDRQGRSAEASRWRTIADSDSLGPWSSSLAPP